jgi:hypothetical protein
MKFKVQAEVRYHVDIGVFEAESAEEALVLAEQSDGWLDKSRRHTGGFYDTAATPIKGTQP